MDEIKVLLADNPGLGSIRLCECNSIHLSIGPVTITLAPEAFAQAAIMIRKAMEQLAEIIASKETGSEPIDAFAAYQARFVH